MYSLQIVLRLKRSRPYLVIVKQLRSFALRVRVHDFKQLTSQLEGRPLEVDTPRGVAEHETKVNMDDVTSLTEHDVAIVPVLDLQEEANQAVACHALHKVPLGLQAGRCALHTIYYSMLLLTLEYPSRLLRFLKTTHELACAPNLPT